MNARQNAESGARIKDRESIIAEHHVLPAVITHLITCCAKNADVIRADTAQDNVIAVSDKNLIISADSRRRGPNVIEDA